MQSIVLPLHLTEIRLFLQKIKPVNFIPDVLDFRIGFKA